MDQPPDTLSSELEAMAAIGQVLSELTDLAARRRVLKWAGERFAADGALAPAPLAAEPDTAPAPANDPALAVDALDDMFVVSAHGVGAAHEMDDDFGEFGRSAATTLPPVEAAKPPLDVVIRSFAADFQRFAEEWNGATL